MMAITMRGREFEPAALRRGYREISSLVIADLAELCFAGETTFADTDRQTCVNIGRQQVWVHINRFLGLSQEQIEGIYVGRGYELSKENE